MRDRRKPYAVALASLGFLTPLEDGSHAPGSARAHYNLESEEPFDDRQGQEDEVEREHQLEAHLELEDEAAAGEQVADHLVQIRVVQVEGLGDARQPRGEGLLC